MLRLRRIYEYLSESLWVLPLLLLIGFVGLATGASYFDMRLSDDLSILWLYGGSPEGARTALATIATSMLSLAALVFSITLVVLQLASSQLTPRIIPLFLQDPWSKTAMGVFLGTFAYSLVGLWFIRAPSESASAFVPVITVSLAFVAVAVSLVTFLNYIHRVAQSIRLETVAAVITRQVKASLDDNPAFARSPESESDELDNANRITEIRDTGMEYIVPAQSTGLLIGISMEKCEQWARDKDVVVEFLVPVGRLVTEGSRVVRLMGVTDEAGFPVSEAFSLDSGRTITLDPEYGLHELVDIAVRALSTGVNAPGMAIVILDRVHEILHEVGRSAGAALASGGIADNAWVMVPRLTWNGWVSLGLREIIDYGQDSAQVCRRVISMLEDLLKTLPSDRHPALQRYLNEARNLPGAQRPYLEWTRMP